MTRLLAILSAVAAVVAAPATAQPSGGLAIDILANPKADALDVGSFAISDTIDNRYSGYGANVQPDLYWTGGPKGTQSYAVLVEDADARPGGKPVAHWVVFNIPTAVVTYPEGGRFDTPPPGLTTGANIAGQAAYMGPKPPAGQTHHYHFEVFAADRTLPLAEGASRDAVVAALKGHVLAQGEMVATFAAPAN